MRKALLLLAVVLSVILAQFLWSGDPALQVVAPPPATAFRFVQLCDTQIGFGGFEHDVDTLEKAVAHINQLAPDFVLLCGDMVSRPDDAAAVAAYKEHIAKLQMPCHVVPGNHDIGHPHTAAGLDRYRELFGPDRYRFDFAGHRFLVVNTTLARMKLPDAIAEQEAWLSSELTAAAAGQWPVIVAGHHPLFVIDPKEPPGLYNFPEPYRSRWLDAFADHGVYAFLTGHAHANFEKNYRGVRLVTTASTSLNLDNSPMGFRLWHIGADGSYQDEFIAVAGAVPPADSDARRKGMLQRSFKQRLNKVLPNGATDKIFSLIP